MSKYRIKIPIVPLLIPVVFVSACSLFQQNNNLIGKYIKYQRAVPGASTLKIFADKTFYISTQSTGPRFYSEGSWDSDKKYLFLYFNPKPGINKTYEVTENVVESDSILFKITYLKKDVPFAGLVIKTKDSVYNMDVNYYSEAKISKQEIDSISVQWFEADNAKYSVKNKKANFFLINLYEAKGQFDYRAAKYYPDTLKLLIKGDKLFTDQAYKDTANWDNYFGINHYERAQE